MCSCDAAQPRGPHDSADGGAWAYRPHDHARSRAYRWNGWTGLVPQILINLDEDAAATGDPRAAGK